MGKKLIINFYVTYNCNLTCEYCQVYDNKITSKKYNIFLDDEFENFISLYKEYSIEIEFFGGEPLLEGKFIKEFVSRYKNKFKYKITTNGLLLDNSYSFLSEIYISVHFQSIEKLSKLIKNGSYNNLKQKISFTFVIDKNNLDLYYNFSILLKNEGFTNINILPVFCKYNWETNDLKELNTLVLYLKNKGFDLAFLGYESNKKDFEFSIDISGDLYSFTGELIYDERLKNKYYIGNIVDIGSLDKEKIYEAFSEINEYSFITNAQIRQGITHKNNGEQTVQNFVFMNKLLNYYKKHI